MVGLSVLFLGKSISRHMYRACIAANVFIERGVRELSKVELRPNEPLERALRRFKKKVDREGIIQQIRRHEHYEKPSQRKRREKTGKKK